MSNAVFPTFPGLSFESTRTPVWSTTTKTSVSQRSFTSANASYPIYRYKLHYEVLRQTPGYAEMTAMVGFFNSRLGGFDSFLFTDPDDNRAVAQAFGVGTGTATQFQLVRTFGGYVEPIYDLNGTPAISVAGVLKTAGADYLVSAGGLVTFTTAPPAGAALTWTCSYYRRVLFAQDSIEFVQFLAGRWNAKTVELMSKKP